MRKGLILLLTLILIAILAFLAIQGLDKGNMKILSYTQLEDESVKLETYADEFEIMNANELEIKRKEILGKIEQYQETKQDYQTRLAQREANLAQMGTGNLSDIDFLLVKVGNYATEHKLNLLFEITKNISDPNADQYMLTDLNFKVEGIYFEIAQYINKLEKDEKLSFEIRDFKMVNGGTSELVDDGIEDNEVSPVDIDPETGEPVYNIVTATFKVYGVPIKKNSLLELSAPATSTNTTNTTNTTTQTNTASSTVTNTND